MPHLETVRRLLGTDRADVRAQLGAPATTMAAFDRFELPGLELLVTYLDDRVGELGLRARDIGDRLREIETAFGGAAAMVKLDESAHTVWVQTAAHRDRVIVTRRATVAAVVQDLATETGLPVTIEAVGPDLTTFRVRCAQSVADPIAELLAKLVAATFRTLEITGPSGSELLIGINLQQEDE